ncbi:MAG: hypothetical protein Ct9H90mP13_08640 [Pseudomonadota bacterium]|nr:MAG: hypothetical protein Ct9H90mP13_08640 [Pseudomonadota bacterium]
MSKLFKTGAKLSGLSGYLPQKGIWIGAMAMVGGVFMSQYTLPHGPKGEFGGMGLEGLFSLDSKMSWMRLRTKRA